MAMVKWCTAFVALLGLIHWSYAVPKKCVNTPFDLVFASEDSSRVIPDTVVEINRVLKAMAAQLDIGGQHRIAYLTMRTNAVTTNFDLDDHNTLANLNTAIDNVGDQDQINANAQIVEGVIAIRNEFASNPKAGVAKLGLVIDATNFNPAALATESTANGAAGIVMHAVGVGRPTSSIQPAVSAIVQHPPNDRYRLALAERDYNFLRDDELENPLLRLFCPGDIGGRCGRDTFCNKADNTVCVKGNCQCNPGLQNENGVCITGPVIGQTCNKGECSVGNSECLLGVCTCREGFTAVGTSFCDDDEDDLTIEPAGRVISIVAAALPFLLTSVQLQNPSTLALVARR